MPTSTTKLYKQDHYLLVELYLWLENVGQMVVTMLCYFGFKSRQSDIRFI